MQPLILRSETLSAIGVTHGFTTRHLGWDRLRDPAAVPAPWRKALASGHLATAQQVHGDRLLWVGRGSWSSHEEADALATAEDRAVAVRTADCVPLLLADPRRGVVVAVHAGWKGTWASIAAKVVEALVADGSRADELVGALGPSIGVCCFEVSPELAERFELRFGAAARRGRHVDLLAVNRIQLEARGIRRRAIDHVGGCTRCQPERFFSYRGEGTAAGRQVAFICGESLS